ncbi:MAG: hypothetical protein GTN53_39715 [Candidatus Aminicenantes bacterium]|nr:hypothetical protein [Candidatus Aminicenantes bacterium]NIQ72609.1 hypothetical protein [Candidatus Aminicenantes bacterium]NIT28643.1 hypothetical protein [Candidatus Aminicenantes bacterium]
MNNKNRKISTNLDFGIYESQLTDEEAKQKGLVKFGKYWVTPKDKT